MGNGFPGLAVVSVIALLAALGCAALLSLQPWVDDEVTPRLSVAPGLGASLGEAVAVSPGGKLAVAPARPVAGGEQSGLVTVGATGGEGDSRPRLGIAAARAVARPLPGRPPQGSPPQQPPAGSAPATPAPTPVAVPVSVPASPSPEATAPPTEIARGGGSSPSGPIGAGAGGGAEGAVKVREGDEYAFSLPVSIQSGVYRSPGDENLILRFRGEASESPSFGLQLWDDGSGQRGLWSSGEAMGGERFLAPVAEGVWHQVVVAFHASGEGDGFYLLLLDGQPVDARAWISLIDSGSDSAQIQSGLFRDGELVASSPDVLFGPVQLSETLESVIP